jgi:hypothetical protein
MVALARRSSSAPPFSFQRGARRPVLFTGTFMDLLPSGEEGTKSSTGDEKCSVFGHGRRAVYPILYAQPALV